MSDLLGVRLSALVVLFVSTLIAGVVPMFIMHLWQKKKAQRASQDSMTNLKKTMKPKDSYIVQVLMQFGGGVLFCTVFGHLIPELRENFGEYTESNGTKLPFLHKNEKHGEPIEIPYVEMAICAGFFVVYLVEELMHFCLSHYNKENDNKYLTQVVVRKTNDNEAALGDGSVVSSVNGINGSFTTMDKCPGDSHLIKCPTDERLLVSDIEPLVIRVFRGLVIIGAFSIHSVFDGLAIGLQMTPSEIWALLFAVSMHKLVIAFVVSMELYEKCVNVIVVFCHMVLFSLMSPVGILIVVLTEESMSTNSESNIVIILLSALATGTILYIVFFEVLQKSNFTRLPGLVQYAAMLAGFIVMFCLTVFLSD